jgi:hypothetical protein
MIYEGNILKSLVLCINKDVFNISQLGPEKSLF